MTRIIFIALCFAASPAFAQRTITQGATDQSVELLIIDDTTGQPETGVAYNTSGIDLWYRRPGAAKVSITEATLASLTTAHTDGGFLEIANGLYRLDLPDAAFAAGASHVTIGGTVTGMIVRPVTVQLTAFDLQAAIPATAPAGYKTVTRIATTDNAETIIEAASAGTLIVFDPGTHTRNADIAVPAGVDITAASRESTTLTGDPGDGTASLLRFAGRNRISNLRIVATGDGHCLATVSGGAACDLYVADCNLVGKDDTVILNSTASGRHFFTCERTIIDSTVWDGVSAFVCDVDLIFRNCAFRGANKNIYIVATTQTVRVSLFDCAFNNSSTTSGTEAGIYAQLSLAGRVDVSMANCHYTGAAEFVNAIAGASGTIRVNDLGGNNLHTAATSLSGDAEIVPVYAEALLDQALASHTTAGTLGKVVSDAGTNAATAATQAAAALKPTTAGRTLDVTATGAAGIDFGNVENQGSTLNLSGTTIKDATDVNSDTDTLLTRLSAANAQVLADWADGGRLDVLLDAAKGMADTFAAMTSANAFTEAALAEAPAPELGEEQIASIATAVAGEVSAGPAAYLAAPDFEWTLPNRSSGRLRALETLRLAPGESCRVGWKVEGTIVLPPGAVPDDLGAPTGLSGELSAELLGTGGRWIVVKVTASADATPGTDQLVSVEVTNTHGGGPYQLLGRALVVDPEADP